MIPKKIHYCWFGGGRKSNLIQKCMKTWQKHLGDYEFVLWDETNSPIDHPYVDRALREKQYAFASDYVRLYALYQEGGIYLDTDMEILKPLDDLLHNSFFIGRESNEWIGVGIAGATPYHRLLKQCLLAYDRLENFETIPKVLTPIIEKYQSDESVRIYEPSYFYPYYPFNGGTPLMGNDIKDHTYAIHHWAKSWTVNPSQGTGICVNLKRMILKITDFIT